MNGDYLKTDRIPVESTIWSPCGREALLNIKSSIEVRPKTPDTFMQMQVDSADIKYTQRYQLQWRPCPAETTATPTTTTPTTTTSATTTASNVPANLDFNIARAQVQNGQVQSNGGNPFM
jgi:hypothetical protein